MSKAKTTTLKELLKELKFTVKGVKFHEGHDGYGLNCKVMIDGKVIAHAHDDANGGEVEVRPEKYTEANRDALRELEGKIYDRKTFKHLYEYEDDFMGEPKMYAICLETLVNEAVEIFEEEKFEKGKTMFKKGILLEDGSYLSWGKVSIPTLFKKYPQQKIMDTLQKAYDGEVAKGSVVVNKPYLESVGVKV